MGRLVPLLLVALVEKGQKTLPPVDVGVPVLVAGYFAPLLLIIANLTCIGAASIIYIIHWFFEEVLVRRRDNSSIDGIQMICLLYISV